MEMLLISGFLLIIIVMALYLLAFYCGYILGVSITKKSIPGSPIQTDPAALADQDSPDIKSQEKPTQSSVMHYPTPEEVRKGKAKEVVDTFFQHLIGGKEKKSGTISDPQGL